MPNDPISSPGYPLEIDTFPHRARIMVVHMLSSAWLMIMREWRRNLRPNVTDVKLQVNLAKGYEEYLVIQYNSFKKFQKTWTTQRSS